MNYAIIGLGYWGKNYYRILNSNDNINLSAVVDSNQNVALDEETEHFLTLEQLIKDLLMMHILMQNFLVVG